MHSPIINPIAPSRPTAFLSSCAVEVVVPNAFAMPADALPLMKSETDDEVVPILPEIAGLTRPLEINCFSADSVIPIADETPNKLIVSPVLKCTLTSFHKVPLFLCKNG